MCEPILGFAQYHAITVHTLAQVDPGFCVGIKMSSSCFQCLSKWERVQHLTIRHGWIISGTYPQQKWSVQRELWPQQNTLGASRGK